MKTVPKVGRKISISRAKLMVVEGMLHAAAMIPVEWRHEGYVVAVYRRGDILGTWHMGQGAAERGAVRETWVVLAIETEHSTGDIGYEMVWIPQRAFKHCRLIG